MGKVPPFSGVGGAGQPPTAVGGGDLVPIWPQPSPMWDRRPPPVTGIPSSLRELVDFAFGVPWPTEAVLVSRLRSAYELFKRVTNGGGGSIPIARTDAAGLRQVYMPPSYEEAVGVAHDLIADGRPSDAMRMAGAFFDSRNSAAALLLEAMWSLRFGLKSKLLDAVRSWIRWPLFFDMTSKPPPVYSQGDFDRFQGAIASAQENGYPFHVELWGSTIPSVASGASPRHKGWLAWANPVLWAAELAALAHGGPYANKVVIVVPRKLHVNTLFFAAMLMVVEDGEIVIVSERGQKPSLDFLGIFGLRKITQSLATADLSMLEGHLSPGRADMGAQPTIVGGRIVKKGDSLDRLLPPNFLLPERASIELTRIRVGETGAPPGGSHNVGDKGSPPVFPDRSPPDMPTGSAPVGGAPAAGGGIGGVHYYYGGSSPLEDPLFDDLRTHSSNLPLSSGLLMNGSLAFGVLPPLPVAPVAAPPIMAPLLSMPIRR